MAFMFSGANSGKQDTSTGQGYVSVDASVKGKLTDAGYQLTPVAVGPEALNSTTGVQKQLLPGSTVPGYQDHSGNFYILDEQAKVHLVTDNPLVTTANNNPIRTGLPLNPTGGVGGGMTYTPPIVADGPPRVPPSPGGGGSLGSGRIYTPFDGDDILPNQQEVVTRALWSGNNGNLLTHFTSSAQTATQQRYYYEVFNSASSACSSEAQYSVAWGHKNGSGSADEGGQVNDTPSRAIYGQYRLLCLEPTEQRFTINGTTTDSIYVVNVNRARMRESLDEGNLELNLAALSGSEFGLGGGNNNSHTGSNVRLSGTGRVIRLIDDSIVNSATITSAGEIYQMVSGSIENGVYNSSNPHIYGLMYKRLGLVVLNGDTLNLSASFNTVSGSEVSGDNAFKLFTAISGAAKYTDLSGDYLGFAGRSAEKVKSTHYFCRVKNAEYNFSNNPTFITGSEGDLAEPTFYLDPRVYITTVGLYNARKECIAVAKISRALQKSFTRECLLKIKLDFIFVLGILSTAIYYLG